MSHRSGLPGVEGTALGTSFYLDDYCLDLDFSSYVIYLASIPFSAFRTLNIIIDVGSIY